MDVADITESAFGNESTEGEVETVTVTLRLAGSDDGADQRDAEMWGHYGFFYRPAAPDGDHKCQALYDDVAGNRAVLATRDTRATDAAGSLNPGDVAVWSVGKNAMRLNADGSVSILQQGSETDAYISIEKDGTILIGNQWGQIELGPDGFKVITAKGEALALGNGEFSVLAPTGALNVGVIKLHAAAAVPLAMVPTIVPTGTAVPAFAVTKPVPNVFI